MLQQIRKSGISPALYLSKVCPSYLDHETSEEAASGPSTSFAYSLLPQLYNVTAQEHPSWIMHGAGVCHAIIQGNIHNPIQTQQIRHMTFKKMRPPRIPKDKPMYEPYAEPEDDTYTESLPTNFVQLLAHLRTVKTFYKLERLLEEFSDKFDSAHCVEALRSLPVVLASKENEEDRLVDRRYLKHLQKYPRFKHNTDPHLFDIDPKILDEERRLMARDEAFRIRKYLDNLQQLTHANLRYLHPTDVAVGVWSLGRLVVDRRWNTDRARHQAVSYAHTLLNVLRNDDFNAFKQFATADDIVHLASGLLNLGFCYQTEGGSSSRNIRKFNPASVEDTDTNFVSSYDTGVNDVLQHMARVVVTDVKHFTADDVAIVTRALSIMGFYDDAVYTALADHAMTIPQGFTAEGAAQSLWGFHRAKAVRMDVFRALLEQLPPQLIALRPVDISAVVHAAAGAQVQGMEHVLNLLGDKATRDVRQFNALQVAITLEGLARLGISHVGFRSVVNELVLEDHTQGTFACTVHVASLMLSAYGRMGEGELEEVDRDVVAVFAGAVKETMDDAVPHDLARLLSALNLLSTRGFTDTRLLRMTGSQLLSVIENTSAAHLYIALHALRALSYRHPALETGIITRLTQLAQLLDQPGKTTAPSETTPPTEIPTTTSTTLTSDADADALVAENQAGITNASDAERVDDDALDSVLSDAVHAQRSTSAAVDRRLSRSEARSQHVFQLVGLLPTTKLTDPDMLYGLASRLLKHGDLFEFEITWPAYLACCAGEDVNVLVLGKFGKKLQQCTTGQLGTVVDGLVGVGKVHREMLSVVKEVVGARGEGELSGKLAQVTAHEGSLL